MVINLFNKARLPKKLPQEMQAVVEVLKKTENKEECLKKAYGILIDQYVGCRWHKEFLLLFTADLKKLWGQKSDSHCTNLNYLLRILLIKSGHYQEGGIRLKLTLNRPCSLHQYLNIRISDKKTIDIDPWGDAHGTKFGDYYGG